MSRRTVFRSIWPSVRDFLRDEGTTTFHDPGTCPECGYAFDCSSGAQGTSPKPLDVTFCLRCGAMLRYTAELRVERMPPEDFQSFPKRDQQELRKLQRAIRESAKGRSN